MSICQGGAGTLTSSEVCTGTTLETATASGSGGVSDGENYTDSQNTKISINFPALPAGAIVTSVKTFISFTANSPSWKRGVYVRVKLPTGSFSNEIQPSLLQESGPVVNADFGTWNVNPVGNWLFEFRELNNDNGVIDANITNISVVVQYTLPGVVKWFTAATGGSAIGSGSSFNPVGVPGSGLPDTNTAGTTTYYAACSTNPDCRTPVNFEIKTKPTKPTVGAITHPTCVTATGSFTLTGLPSSGTWTLTRSPGAATITGTGTSTTISDLTAGTYQYTVSNGLCISESTGNIVLNAVQTTSYCKYRHSSYCENWYNT